MFATSVFAFNPFYLEVYRFIANYNELSFAFFFFLTFYLYVKTGKTRCYAALAFLAAVFSKESGLILAPVLLCYDILIVQRGFRETLRRYLPIILAFSLYIVVYIVRGLVVGKFAQPKYYFGFHGLYNLALNIALAAAGPLYTVPCTLLRGGAKYAVFALLAACAVAVALYIATKRRNVLALYRTPLRFGLLWVILTLLPIGFWQGTHTGAARYFYIPYAGVALVVGALFAVVIPENQKSSKGIFTMAIAVYSAFAVVSSSFIPFNERASAVYRTWYETVAAAAPDSNNAIILLGGGPKLSRDNILHGKHDVMLYEVMFPGARAGYYKTEDPGEALRLAEARSPAAVIIWSGNEPVSVTEYGPRRAGPRFGGF